MMMTNVSIHIIMNIDKIDTNFYYTSLKLHKFLFLNKG